MHCILFFCRCLFGKWIDGMSPLFCIYICWEYARQTQRWAANELSNQKVIHWDVVWKNVSRFPGQETSCASAIINLIISWIQFRAMWNMFFHAALLCSSSGRTRTVESCRVLRDCRLMGKWRFCAASLLWLLLLACESIDRFSIRLYLCCENFASAIVIFYTRSGYWKIEKKMGISHL